MTPRQIDPLTDPRWSAFTESHPRASVFHTPAWLEALKRTYGCVPEALTTAGPGQELSDGLVYCGSSSWLTGKKLISVPFADHCEVLTDRDRTCNDLLALLKSRVDEGGWHYCEIRPLGDSPVSAAFVPAGVYYRHVLDLSRGSDQLFSGFHKDCIQRRIRHAEKEALTYERGVSESLVRRFYRLAVITRRHQGLLPQPIEWYQNLVECMGDKSAIHLASKGATPVAGILTLRHQHTLVYKYSCSDRRFNSMGATPFLLWRAIEDAKSHGLSCLDLGRSDQDNPGLVRFKDRWGATRSILRYWRYGSTPRLISTAGWLEKIARTGLRRMPIGLMPTAGRLVYKHLQ